MSNGISTKKSYSSWRAAGTTEVWQEGQSGRNVFEWQAGSLFTIPLNACHRMVNAANAPALLLCGTSAPNVMNLFDNTNFIFNCPYGFSERFAGGQDSRAPALAGRTAA
jgi:hypothetical protein